MQQKIQWISCSTENNTMQFWWKCYGRCKSEDYTPELSWSNNKHTCFIIAESKQYSCVMSVSISICCWQTESSYWFKHVLCHCHSYDQEEHDESHHCLIAELSYDTGCCCSIYALLKTCILKMGKKRENELWKVICLIVL